MNLYRWSSKAMADYYNGDIIVMAKDVKSAKAKAIREYKKKSENYGYSMDWFKEDLKSEPDVTNGCIFITGGS